MPSPLVSVIVIAFNARATLPMALGSLCAQTLDDFECLAVDDSSTDGSWELLTRVPDARFKALRTPENRGRGASRQQALEQARGAYIAFLDADDWLYPERLARQVSELERSRAAALVTSSMAVADDRRLLGIARCASTGGGAGLSKPAVPFAPCLVRAAVARRVGFNPARRRSEDVAFLTRVLAEQSFVGVRTPLYTYRPSSFGRADLVLSHVSAAEAYAEQRAAYPVRASRLELGARAKALFYRSIPEDFAARVAARVQRRKVQAASSQERSDYQRALERVGQASRELSGALGLAEG